MGFGVFLHRADSIYDDSLAERYQFPSQYLERVNRCVGDYIVYLEPSKVHATRGYFATARVDRVVPDPGKSGMYLALIKPGSYQDFVTPVAFRGPDGLVETGVLNPAGGISGRAQAAVRPLSTSDFNRIIDRGLNIDTALLPREGAMPLLTGFSEQQAPYGADQSRERISFLSSRLVRDRLFRQMILTAYDCRCAITGLRLINGGGRAEAEAAHIRPVAADGPDMISNGLALSGTAHWMFDRGLLGVADDHRILISRHVNNPDAIKAVINDTGRILQTAHFANRPRPQYLRWHRENCFKS